MEGEGALVIRWAGIGCHHKYPRPTGLIGYALGALGVDEDGESAPVVTPYLQGVRCFHHLVARGGGDVEHVGVGGFVGSDENVRFVHDPHLWHCLRRRQRETEKLWITRLLPGEHPTTCR